MVVVHERLSQETLRVVREPQIPGRPPVDHKRAAVLDDAVATRLTGGTVVADPGAEFVASYVAARTAPATRDLPPGDPAFTAATRAELRSESTAVSTPLIPVVSPASNVAK